MNNKGEIVLRNVIFIIIIFSGIIALSSIFVQQMGGEYENTNMTSSYNQDVLGSEQLNATTTEWEEIGQRLSGNLLDMLIGTLKAAGEIFKTVLLAPVTFSNIITSILTDLGVDSSVTNIIGLIISALLYILIIFVIISSFLKGGRM